MTVEEWIKASLRKLSVYASGENPTPEELRDGLLAGQSMLRSWAAIKILAHASNNETFSLTSGNSEFSWGAGATLDSVRPHGLLNAVLTSGTIESPLRILAYSEIYKLVDRTIVGKPSKLYFNPSYPNALVAFDKALDTTYTLKVESIKPFTETSSFDSITATVLFPSSYEEAFIYNLSVRLAPEFGKAVPRSVAEIAMKSYNTLVNLNAANQVESVPLDLPFGINTGSYNINTGE